MSHLVQACAVLVADVCAGKKKKKEPEKTMNWDEFVSVYCFLIRSTRIEMLQSKGRVLFMVVVTGVRAGATKFGSNLKLHTPPFPWAVWVPASCSDLQLLRR